MITFNLQIDLLRIEMKISEFDERLPSFKTELDVNVSHPTGKFTYSANDIWFECNNWDKIIGKMAAISIEGDLLILNSMSDEFIFTLSKNNIEVLIKERSFGGFVSEFHYRQELTSHDIFKIKNAFFEFDRWWL